MEQMGKKKVGREGGKQAERDGYLTEKSKTITITYFSDTLWEEAAFGEGVGKEETHVIPGKKVKAGTRRAGRDNQTPTKWCVVMDTQNIHLTGTRHECHTITDQAP